jgi:serine/threonine-protein kinase RsbT
VPLVGESRTLPILVEEDVVRARQFVRGRAQEAGFSLIDQTKLVTAASELARNALVHGGGGEMRVSNLNDTGRSGIRLEFIDQGPGIEDMDLALRGGYSTGTGLGLGLSGSRRLVNEFEIESSRSTGTRVVIAKWQ